MDCTEKHQCSWLVQTWKGQERLTDDIGGLSYDAAMEIAGIHSSLGYTVRLWAEPIERDYTEIWQGGIPVRRGPFAQTTQVIVCR